MASFPNSSSLESVLLQIYMNGVYLGKFNCPNLWSKLNALIFEQQQYCGFKNFDFHMT